MTRPTVSEKVLWKILFSSFASYEDCEDDLFQSKAFSNPLFQRTMYFVNEWLEISMEKSEEKFKRFTRNVMFILARYAK